MTWDGAEITVRVPNEAPVKMTLDGMKVEYEPFNEGGPDGPKKNILHLRGVVRNYERLPVEVVAPTVPETAPNVGAAAVEPSPMRALWEDWKDCMRCPLATVHRRNVVFGSGNIKNPRVLIIGEAPGPDENIQGVPFIGKTGEKLRNTLLRVGLHPDEDCFITNSVLCFPTEDGNSFRAPKAAEMLACRPRLEQQFSLLGGTLKAVLLVGKRAYVDFMRGSELVDKKFERESDFESLKMKDKLGWYTGVVPWEDIKVMTVYHPSYFMRQKLSDSSLEVVEWTQDLKALADWALRGEYWNGRTVR